METDYHLVVIGGGSAGISCTVGAATLGARVLLFERDKMGGDCLNDGCIPSKAFIKAANVAWNVRQAQRFGTHVGEPEVRFSAVIRYVQDVIKRVAVHDQASNFQEMGAKVVFGSPHFNSPRDVTIDYYDSQGRHVYHAFGFKNCVIATGTRPRIPDIPGLAETGFITNAGVFHLDTQPRRLVVIGGGPVGCELGQAFSRLGTHVTIVDSRLLKKEDPDVSDAVRDFMQAEGIHCCLDNSVLRVERRGTDKVVTLQRGEELVCDEILVAAGRQANIEGLELQAAGVEVDAHGFVACDDRLRTTAPRIWACGDVHGRYLFSHMAEYEARYIILQSLLHLPLKPSYRVVPWTTFTDPEVAHVGLTEAEAKHRNIRYEVWRFDTSDVDRAMTDSETRGFFKILTGARGTILGVSIVAPQAGEIIHEAVLAMQHGLTARDLSDAIHVYPTMAMGLRRAADDYTLKNLAPRWLLRLVQLLLGYRRS